MHSCLDVSSEDVGLVACVDRTRAGLVVGECRETTLQAHGDQLLV
jgi:hypothetical protein